MLSASEIDRTIAWTIQMGAVVGWLIIVGGMAWVVQRHTVEKSELVRKIVHIGTGNVILLAWWLQIPAWIAIVASLLFSGLTLLSYYLPVLPGINSVGRKSLGTFFYAVSIGILVAWFWPLHLPQFAVLGILIMTWGDGMAALVGQHWGRHRYMLWGMQKSWEGSLTMCIISYSVSSLILLSLQFNIWQISMISISVAILATVLEAFSKLGIDNLTVPIGSAAIGFWLSHWWL